MTPVQFQLTAHVVAAGGQPASGAQYQVAAAVVGDVVGGMTSSDVARSLRSGYSLASAIVAPSLRLISVSGTVDEPEATVTVNGMPATSDGTTWTVSGVVLYAGPNTLTAVARDPAGYTATSQILVYFDPSLPEHLHLTPHRITVTGTVDDPAANLTVNLLHHATVSVTQPATMTGTTWVVSNVPLYDGLNTLTATARDAAGNSSTQTVHVFLDTEPPARPTVEVTPEVTTALTYTFTGTKPAGTSIWINGQQAVPISPATTWSVTLPLIEGDNPFTIVTHDEAGNVSTAVSLVIVVDNLPPVLTVTPADGFKTNFDTVALTGTVDDHLTTVDIPGLSVARAGLGFTAEAALPAPHAYTWTITATSPNGFVTTQTLHVTRGTIPTIAVAAPADAMKAYWQQPLTLSMTATDAEQDPIEYQVLLDGRVYADWSSTNAFNWAPSLMDWGVHALEFRARDAYGGYASQTHDVFILRPPVSP